MPSIVYSGVVHPPNSIVNAKGNKLNFKAASPEKPQSGLLIHY